MTGQKKQDGTIDRTFLQGLDLILGSLIQKNDNLGEAPQPDINGDVDLASVIEDDGGELGKQSDSKKRAKDESSESDEPQTDSLEIATDLGDKTNLPPEMGRKGDKGGEGIIDDGTIAEPMLRRREVRKSVLGNMERGTDLFQLWANVDRVIEKSSDYSPHISDVDILKS